MQTVTTIGLDIAKSVIQVFRQRNGLGLATAVGPSRNFLSFASAGGAPTNASSVSQRLAATCPLTDGGARFAI